MGKRSLYNFINFYDHGAMLRILFVLLAVWSPSATAAFAGERDAPPVSVLVERAREALAKGDEKAYLALVERLFERAAEMELSSAPPEGMREKGRKESLCEYSWALERILSSERVIESLAISAFSLVRQGKEERAGEMIWATECVREGGRKPSTRSLLRDGITWAKKVQAADAEKAEALAREYETLAKRHPQDELYRLRAWIAREQASFNSAEARKKEFNSRTSEETAYQVTLVARAYLGDLAKQLEVARRLETGDKFRQDDAKAFFWYQRALRNGGGEAAQTGMDRLFPRLSEEDLAAVQVWADSDGRPY